MAAAILVIALAFSACSTYNQQTIGVSLSQTLADNTVQVDIAGIKEKDINTYYDISSDQYWALDSKYRNSLTKDTIVFCPGKPLKRNLSDSSAIWNIWDYKKCNYLLIAADLPPTVANNTNWKLIIPMDYYMPINFWSDRTSKFIVDMTGLIQID